MQDINKKKSDYLIKESLEEYKHLIDAGKINGLSVSNYRVEKPWGYEIWLEINEYYTYKLICMTKGTRCSLQSHKYKYETNFVIEGEAEVLLENENGVLESKIFVAGTGWSTPIGKKHRVIAKTTYKSLEVSTTHLNDVIRYEDDNNRESGKIKKEHAV